MKLAPALVPLEAWFWYMLFLDLLSAKPCSKTVSQIFPVMFQSLLKLHYVYTAWLHKISPTLIVRRICFINSIRNLRHGFADNRSKNNIYQNQASRGTHFPALFRVCVKKFYLSGQIIVDLWFKVNPEVFPWHICDFYSRKWGTTLIITGITWNFSWLIMSILPF
jgi:hypothetical protein